MISPVSGEVVFADGLRFSPHEALSANHIRDARSHSLLPIPGWTQHLLGVHPSHHGPFEVEAISDRESRIQAVLVAHIHSFYQRHTPNAGSLGLLTCRLSLFTAGSCCSLAGVGD